MLITDTININTIDEISRLPVLIKLMFVFTIIPGPNGSRILPTVESSSPDLLSVIEKLLVRTVLS